MKSSFSNREKIMLCVIALLVLLLAFMMGLCWNCEKNLNETENNITEATFSTKEQAEHTAVPTETNAREVTKKKKDDSTAPTETVPPQVEIPMNTSPVYVPPATEEASTRPPVTQPSAIEPSVPVPPPEDGAGDEWDAGDF